MADDIEISIITERLRKVLDLTDSLSADLGQTSLGLRNGSTRSNTIGEQFWCLVGARESYSRAFVAGAWQGFSCSLTDAESPMAVRSALAASHTDLTLRFDQVGGNIDPNRASILFDLLEHEVQHHGQLIRFFYANDLPFPTAFAQRYALGD